LDVDHDGTLDLKELGHRVTRAEFLAADKDKDGTLGRTEYQSLVAQRFQAANRDNDATIEAKELHTSAGRRLMELLM
jgi:Ca2+-binding EF-hand superfamily protein